jgi:hypothetical protein
MDRESKSSGLCNYLEEVDIDERKTVMLAGPAALGFSIVARIGEDKENVLGGNNKKTLRKRILGGLKAYLRATDHTSTNIISRDY